MAKNKSSGNYLMYLALILFFIFYFILAFTGLLPLISYSYGLILMRVIGGLSNIDRYIMNVVYYVCVSPTPTQGFQNYVFGNNIRQNMTIINIINFIIGSFILYISFRSMTVLVFFIINSMMLRNICDSLHISFGASNPITMIYMFVFIGWGIASYMIDFSKKLTKIAGTSTFGKIVQDVIIGIADYINSFLTFILEFFIMLIPFIGPAMKEVLSRIKQFLVILELLSEQVGSSTCSQEEGINNIILELHKLTQNNKKEIILQKFDRIFGINLSLASGQNKQEIFIKINEIINELLNYFQQKNTSFKSIIIGGVACFIIRLMNMYKSYNKYLGGADKIYNIIIRGFLAAASSLTIVFIIILLMVVFRPCYFYPENECPNSLR